MPSQVGPLGCGHALVALLADEHDLVADVHGVVARDHQLIHGHDADDRPSSPADEHLTACEPEVATYAIRVSDRDGRDDGVYVEGVAEPVGDAFASSDDLHERHLGPQPHRGAQPGFRDQRIDLGRGCEPVDRDAAADEVVTRRGMRDRTSGIRHVRERHQDVLGADETHDLVERRELAAREVVVWFVLDRAVREDAAEHELGPPVDRPRESEGLVGAASDAVHPSVDLEVQRPDGRARRAEHCTQRLLDAVERVDGRLEVVLERSFHRIERRLGEHDDPRGDALVAQRDALFDERDRRGSRRRLRVRRPTPRVRRGHTRSP